MYSKKYMHERSQKSCMKLIEEGYVQTFEEIHKLSKMYSVVRKEAEHGFLTMPNDFRKEPEILRRIEQNLKRAEKAIRKGSFEENYRSRMDLGKYFHGLEGYHWLAEYFYESSQHYGFDTSIDLKLEIKSIQGQSLLEETRGNLDIALNHLKKAMKIAKTKSLDPDDPVFKALHDDVCRVYQKFGTKCMEEESDAISENESLSLKYLIKATKIADASDNPEIQATCQASLGNAMLKFNKDDSALKCFEVYISLSEKCGNKYGICQGYFAISEIYKRSADWRASISALQKCWNLAKENSFDIPLAFSAISLGQIETAKGQYLKAAGYFEEAYNTVMTSNEDYKSMKSLKKLAKVMYGIGTAHLSFHRLVRSLQTSDYLSLPQVLSWRCVGGPFTGAVIEDESHTIDMSKTEKDYSENEIEKLMNVELKQE